MIATVKRDVAAAETGSVTARLAVASFAKPGKGLLIGTTRAQPQAAGRMSFPRVG